MVSNQYAGQFVLVIFSNVALFSIVVTPQETYGLDMAGDAL